MTGPSAGTGFETLVAGGIGSLATKGTGSSTGCVMAVTFSRPFSCNNKGLFFSFLTYHHSSSFSFSFQHGQNDLFYFSLLPNRTLQLLKEGFTNEARRSAGGRGPTSRVLFKPSHRFLLSSMALPPFNRLLFLGWSQRRIPDSRTRRNRGRLQPRSKESDNAAG